MGEKAKSQHLSVVMSDEEKERLRKLAEEEERTMSQLASKLIREGMDKLEAQKKAKE